MRFGGNNVIHCAMCYYSLLIGMQKFKTLGCGKDKCLDNTERDRDREIYRAVNSLII